MGCALVAALLAALVRRAGGRDARCWAGLAVILSLLSLDEAVALHERLGGPAGEVLGDATRGPLHFAWVVPGAVLALVLAPTPNPTRSPVAPLDQARAQVLRRPG
jgi:hypothetical protein